MIADLLHGGPEAAGFMTSGGTESILLAVKAARTRGRARGITAPEMVLPTSAHAAFEKGAAYFDVRSVRVPVGADYRADPAAMAAAMTPNTMLLVASAPAYPQGVIDPVTEIAALAAARDINCHVDACMGGITLPMLERLGQAVAPFDFRVPGVTSMSVDLHKYGYTAKGASVILHRNKALRKDQTFVTDNWLGGLYGSSGVLGTKSGGPIAAAWAVLRYLGEDGYLRLTRMALEATDPAHRRPARHARRARARRAGGDAGRVHVRRRRSVRRRRRARRARLGRRPATAAAEPALHRQCGARRRDPRVPRGVARRPRRRARAPAPQRAYGVVE